MPASKTRIAGWVLLGVPLPLQLIAAVFGFHGRSATAATGSSALAAAWLGTSLAPSHAVGMLSIEGPLLPTFRAKESAQALSAHLDAQVEKLENEAGVRKNL